MALALAVISIISSTLQGAHVARREQEDSQVRLLKWLNAAGTLRVCTYEVIYLISGDNKALWSKSHASCPPTTATSSQLPSWLEQLLVP